MFNRINTTQPRMVPFLIFFAKGSFLYGDISPDGPKHISRALSASSSVLCASSIYVPALRLATISKCQQGQPLCTPLPHLMGGSRILHFRRHLSNQVAPSPPDPLLPRIAASRCRRLSHRPLDPMTPSPRIRHPHDLTRH